MKEEEIKQEIELCVRSYLEAKDRVNEEGLDKFHELRILEVGFNRLFMSVEHLCNAIMLFEKGNFSRKHFGDIIKLRELNKKYGVDIAQSYQTTYNFRSYADYRKCPEVEDHFTKEELQKQVTELKEVIQKTAEVMMVKGKQNWMSPDGIPHIELLLTEFETGE